MWRVGWGRNRTDEELWAVLADEAAARWQRKAAAVMLASRWVVRSGQYDPAQVGVYGSRRTVADSVGQWVRFAWVGVGRRPVVGLEVCRVVGRVLMVDGGWAWCYATREGMVLAPAAESTYRVEVVCAPAEAAELLKFGK